MATPTVAVTGITGFIAAHVTSLLLQKGYTVHGTVRKNTPECTKHLPSSAPGELRVFEADLLEEHSFDAATRGCKYVLHIASPWKMNVKDPYKELIDPAVKGTLNVLRSCHLNNVSKVVLTSSDAALSDGGMVGKVFDESDWNTHSSADFMPYYYSKAEAERQAWKFAEEHELNLVAINPPTVLGPSLTARVNDSALLLIDIAKRDTLGVIDLALACVDVRDVAEVHVRAMENDAAKGRYVCCPLEPMVHMREFAQWWKRLGLDPKMNELTRPVVTNMLRLFASFWAGEKADVQFMQNHLGRPLVMSGKKVVDELGMVFRTTEETALDAMKDLMKWGHVQEP